MAEFLTTKGTASQIEDIIKDASKKLVLISPYLQISDSFYSRLKAASARAVSIIIVYRKNELKEGQYELLSSLNNVQLRSLKSLHAKCYYNEREMVITSMNMYEYSENKNIEMGIVINIENDSVIFSKALAECNYVLESSIADFRSNSKKEFSKNLKAIHTKAAVVHSHEGFCIRCAHEIALNPQMPYCDKCFSIWNKYGNKDYGESVCHGCGDVVEEISMNKPQCPKCYRTLKKEERSNHRKTG